MSAKAVFSTKIGLIAATVGSAIGLGNVWRFPAETQANGGAAFLLLYIGCVLLLGIPVMLAEFSIGRGGRSDAIGSFRKLAPGQPWWILGLVAVLASFLITVFYMVVEGWTFEYLYESLFGGLFNPSAQESSLNGTFDSKMTILTHTPLEPSLFTAFVILINICVLLGGVQKVIERLSNILMPLLFIILVFLAIVSLTLPGGTAGLEFFLSPDFSKLTPEVFVNALGQAFFSLSLGMGILITYSSYYPADTKLPRTSLTVSLLSLLVAILMGFIIFPAVMTFGLDKNTLEGATLVFVTLPEVFAHLPAPQLWSTLFFSLLFVAALTSTVSLAEVVIAMLQDRLGWTRKKAVLIALTPLFVLSILCSLSFSVLADLKIFGFSLFDFLDNFATNILLPVVAFLTCVYLGWKAPKGFLKSELTNGGALHSKILPCIALIIRWIAPALILVIFITQFF